MKGGNTLTAKHRWMEQPQPEPKPAFRYLEQRVEKKGLRPRFAAAVIATSWTLAIVTFGIVQHLIDPDRFDNVWLGMWWATQTVTTVGYGDTVPNTTAGDLVAVLLMIGGLSLFSVVTGVVTSEFVARAQARRQQGGNERLEQKLDQLAADLEAVREQLTRTRETGRSPPRPPGQ
jgi:voltage-gated potassium channel